MQLTYFGANSWLLEVGGMRVLLDPWLVGSLTFGGQGWFFEGINPNLGPIPGDIDLILLSQGLPDHAHRPTLERLDRQIPVVGSLGAARLATRLGYTQVTPLRPGELCQVEPLAPPKRRLGLGPAAPTLGLEIRAFAGAPVPQVENAYLLTQLGDGRTLYYEPHGFAAADLLEMGPVDVVINPVVDLMIPGVGPLVKGRSAALPLAQALQPRYFLPTAAGGNIQYRGLLDRILRSAGTVAEFQEQLAAAGLSTQVLDPIPGQPQPLIFEDPQDTLAPDSPNTLGILGQWWQQAQGFSRRLWDRPPSASGSQP